jgi:hypothetical protein
VSEIRALAEDGTELGYADVRGSRWWMDANGVLWNDEPIRILATADGRLDRMEWRGEREIRSRGTVTKKHRVRASDVIVLDVRKLQIEVGPVKEVVLMGTGE